MEKLMIPGPVSVEDEVLHEMGGPVQAHYGPKWTAIYDETVNLLKQVFRTEGDVHILIGSGSAGLDAAIGSMTAPGETVIVGINGYFGQRLADIGEAYGLNVIPVEAPMGQPLLPSAVESALSKNPDAVAVMVVHLETSTSVLNPLFEIAHVAHQKNVPLVVDAVSSIGGVHLAMDEWHIDVCVGASQKCLGAPPGLAPVAVSQRAWEIMKSKPRRNHGWYLNLEVWQWHAKEWWDWHPFPVTMATNNVMALRAGLRSLLSDGLDDRINRYTQLATRLRTGIRRLGLQLFAPEEQLAPVLTGIRCPDGVSSGDVVDYLYREHSIKIAGGMGAELRHRLFRIGHMGIDITEHDIDAVLNGLAAFMKRN